MQFSLLSKKKSTIPCKKKLISQNAVPSAVAQQHTVIWSNYAIWALNSDVPWTWSFPWKTSAAPSLLPRTKKRAVSSTCENFLHHISQCSSLASSLVSWLMDGNLICVRKRKQNAAESGASQTLSKRDEGFANGFWGFNLENWNNTFSVWTSSS